jgi:hypothetical protein
MKYLYYPFIMFFLLLTACSTEEASEYERTNAEFLDSLGGDISAVHWWRTAVKLKVSVITDGPTKLLLLSSKSSSAILYDYKEVASSETVTMTAPQGQGTTLYLQCVYNGKTMTRTITLSGKTEENVSINTTAMQSRVTRASNQTASLSGNSIHRDAEYHEFKDGQLRDFFKMMELNQEKLNAKDNSWKAINYELETRGPFYITWVTGKEMDQRSHILGYYYHSYWTYDDVQYVDLSETHKWDYIDGKAKVQYKLSIDDEVNGHKFKAGEWYDANFDMHDTYTDAHPNNPDRVGDNCYNAQAVYDRYSDKIAGLRGISFKIEHPDSTRIGFYLRADEEPFPSQWSILQQNNFKPYVNNAANFKGTNFCAEFLNVEGNGGGLHRSFIKDYDEVYWMGLEDLIEGGDHDCNDVIFGVVADLKICLPEIISPPGLREKYVEPKPEDPKPEDPTPEDPEPEETDSFPWTIAYEDVNRNPDFDFNDAVIKVIPDYENEECCVYVMATGNPARMYLHYDGPEGDKVLGEMHAMLGTKNSQTYINTRNALAGTPFQFVGCVPWPKDYTMADDAKRFYIEIQRGTCNDCTDVITLAQEPGQMPEALLVAGEWQWPMEGEHIFDAYDEFSGWAKDVTRTRFWEWYKSSGDNPFIVQY